MRGGANSIHGYLFTLQIFRGANWRALLDEQMNASDMETFDHLDIHAVFNGLEKGEVGVRNRIRSVVKPDFTGFRICRHEFHINTFLGEEAFFFGDKERRNAKGSIGNGNFDRTVFKSGFIGSGSLLGFFFFASGECKTQSENGRER